MGRRVMDLGLVCISLAVFAVAWFYPEEVRYDTVVLWLSGIAGVSFLILAVRDKYTEQSIADKEHWDRTMDSELITEIALLSEEDTELMTWDLYGKTSMVIGRDVKENQVDIDLRKSPYASMVDVEHAVMNYSSGNWYVEDLGSANGIGVRKRQDGKLYRLSADTPCRLERGDCLCVGLNRLLLK